MSLFNVAGKYGKAYCSHCHHELYDAWCFTGCGRPCAVCLCCKRFYVLYCTIFTGDGLMDYLDYKSDPENREWEWISPEEFCLKKF